MRFYSSILPAVGMMALALCWGHGNAKADINPNEMYTVTDLGTLGGQTAGSVAFAINDAGQMAGAAQNSPGLTHAFRSDYNAPLMSMNDIDATDANSSQALAINRNGDIAGSTNTNGRSNSFRYAPNATGAYTLITLGGPFSTGNAINNLDDVAGKVNGLSAGLTIYLYVWGGPSQSDLTVKDKVNQTSMAYGINDKRHVVGAYVPQNGIQYHAFFAMDVNGDNKLDLFSANERIDIHTVLGGGSSDFSKTRAINSKDETVGALTQSTVNHAFYWSSSNGATMLNSLKTDHTGWTDAYAINDWGQIVGEAAADDGSIRAVLWVRDPSSFQYVPIDLSAVALPVNGVSWSLSRAYGINNNGQIVATTSAGHIVEIAGTVWGARCKVTWTDATIKPTYEYLVGYDSSAGNVVFRRSINPYANLIYDPASANNAPIASISAIQIIPDAYDITQTGPKTYQANDPYRFVKYGYDRYNVILAPPAPTATNPHPAPKVVVSLLESVSNTPTLAYQNGQWIYTSAVGLNTSSPTPSGDFLGIYAIPRCANVNPDGNTFKGFAGTTAVAKQIPPHILYGKFYIECNWLPYNRVTDSNFPSLNNGNPITLKDAPGQERTVTTYDGGVGAGQLTGATAVLSSAYGGVLPANTQVLNHLYRASADLAYNIERSGEVLNQKWDVSPSIGNDERNVLENWYYALWAYNGANNNPNNPLFTASKRPYQETVFKFIANGFGLWTPTPVSLPDLRDIDNFMTVQLPQNAIPYTPAPVHMDIMFNGTITAKQPVIDFTLVSSTRNATSKTITVVLRFRNSGNWTASHLTLAAASLGSAHLTPNLSLGMPTGVLAVGATYDVSLTFDATKLGAPSDIVALQANGSFASKNWNYSISRVGVSTPTLAPQQQ